MSDPRYQAIYEVVRSIPRGCVSTYGTIAQRAGLPGRARLVGRVLRESGGSLPWHRVVTASGRIAFPPDDPAHAVQCGRLQAEGVDCPGGRVDLGRYGWSAGTLDALLWGPP